MLTFGDFKKALRLEVFPTGEAPNLVLAHNKSIVDAIIDLQTSVECLQAENTSIYPQCATVFDCGLTVLDAPRGRIKRVSVIDSVPISTPAVSGSGGSSAGALIPNVSVDLGVLSPSDPNWMPQFSFQQDASGPVADRWVFEYTFSSAATVVSYYPHRQMNIGKWQVWAFFGSLDGVTWTLIDDERYVSPYNGSDPSDPANQPSAVARPGAYTKYRLVFVAGPNNQPLAELVDFYGTGGTAPSGTASAENDWCSEIIYEQIDFCHVQRFLAKGQVVGGCRSCGGAPFLSTLFSFFGLDGFCAGKMRYNPPDDAGLEKLPKLPLGQHYAQGSTDSKRRALAGRWALQHGRIFVIPWIQSRESVIVRWDGIKRCWNDADPITDNPTVARGIRLFVMRDHAKFYEKDEAAAAAYAQDYAVARQDLWHECREETRVRGCEPSFARGGMSASDGCGSDLFYNDEQSFTAICPTGTVGRPVKVVIKANTVMSSASKADANAKARQTAEAQAEDQLVCTTPVVTYWNVDMGSVTVQCAGGACWVAGTSPPVEGSPVTVPVPAHIASSVVSQDAANQAAIDLATAQATALLRCTWHNSAQTYVAHVTDYTTVFCPGGTITGTDITVTVAAHTRSSNISQCDADAMALNDAKTQAEVLIDAQWTCSNVGGGGSLIVSDFRSLRGRCDGSFLTWTYSDSPQSHNFDDFYFEAQTGQWSGYYHPGWTPPNMLRDYWLQSQRRGKTCPGLDTSGPPHYGP